MLNPPQASDGEPLRVDGEHFVLKRKGIEFHVNVKGIGKLKGKGRVILTTCRLILINDKDDKDLKCIDLPYANTYEEKFQ